MVKSAIIARIHDGLPLAATIDDEELENDFPDYKAQVKALLRQHLPAQSDPRCSLESADGRYFFHVLCADGVSFVALCDKLYPKRLAYTFLDDVSREFGKEHPRATVNEATRPYAFLKFNNTLQKVKRSYEDVRAKQNVQRLQQELVDVTNIMTQNINHLLERGNKLESMSLMSTNLSMDARKYVRDAQHLNWMAMMERYAVPGVIFGVFILCLWIYFRFL